MNYKEALRVSSQLLLKAKELGADLVGLAAVKDLKLSPSFIFAPKILGSGNTIDIQNNVLCLKPGEVAWPENAKTVMVIAVHHPENQPEMDWWFGIVNPPGNRILANTVRRLCDWIPKQFGINVVHLPYGVEKGGTYLKDAAVLAALGCIGRNNIVVTPEFGPRVRLRALTLDIELPSTGPLSFDPCKLCDTPCRKSCPQNAFAQKQYHADDYGQEQLPGREGVFSRPLCKKQMVTDEAVAQKQVVEGFDNPIEIIKYCRKCELSCPVGKQIPA